MRTLSERLRDAWRRRGEKLDAEAIDDGQVEHEATEREKHRETGLEPGRSNTDWTYVPPA